MTGSQIANTTALDRDDGTGDAVPDNSPLLDALERFAEFIDEIFDGPRCFMHQWEGNCDRLAVRSIGRLLVKWRHAARPDRPPHSLIVRLADRLPSLLSRIVASPKKVLQRRRSMQPVNRLREVDSSCMRWITRQPGFSLVEKAGHRRKLLAVERYESLNTLENRVVRSLLQLGIKRSRDYLRQYGEKFAGHDRVVSVVKFSRLCEWLLRNPIFGEVDLLTAPPQPNYVLLHDDQYKLIWRAYQEIVRQQRRRQLLWTFREEMYAEMSFVAIQHALSLLAEDRIVRKEAHRHEMLIRHSPLEGRIFDSRSSPPWWQMPGNRRVYVGCLSSMAHLNPAPVGVQGLPLSVCRADGVESSAIITFSARHFERPQKQVQIKAQSLGESLGKIDSVTASPVNLLEAPAALREWVRSWGEQR